jgi:hypothetical protein
MGKIIGFGLVIVLVAALVPVTQAQDEFEALRHCFMFENLAVGQTFVVGDTFPVNGGEVLLDEFEWSPGNTTADGMATVDNNGMAGGIGHDINSNNINLIFQLDPPLEKGVALRYGEYGGNVNLMVNGDMANVDDFPELDGANLGGVDIIVNDFGSGLGIIYLIGPIEIFGIGGQELWIDDDCLVKLPETCISFEDFAPDDKWGVGDGFGTWGAEVIFTEFQWSDGTWVDTGIATITTGNMAGGTGQDLNTNNINLTLRFEAPASIVYLRFGEYGGNINVIVNDDLRNFSLFSEVNNTVIGGAYTMVTNGFGNDTGSTAFVGQIENLSVGGQELWLDDICYCLHY